MQIKKLAIPDVLLITPKIFSDERGYLFESFNQRTFSEVVGEEINFVQDNHSLSMANILRGLHYQINRPQGKLVRAISGSVFDVAVDIRQGSPTFGQWVGEILSAENKQQLWIPPGFAHGFLVLTESAEFLYKVTDFWLPGCERSILWNDATLNIKWPLKVPPIVSAKDQNGSLFLSAEF